MQYTIRLLWGCDTVYEEQLTRRACARVGVDERLDRALARITGAVRFPFDRFQILDERGGIYRHGAAPEASKRAAA